MERRRRNWVVYSVCACGLSLITPATIWGRFSSVWGPTGVGAAAERPLLAKLELGAPHASPKVDAAPGFMERRLFKRSSFFVCSGQGKVYRARAGIGLGVRKIWLKFEGEFSVCFEQWQRVMEAQVPRHQQQKGISTMSRLCHRWSEPYHVMALTLRICTVVSSLRLRASSASRFFLKAFFRLKGKANKRESEQKGKRVG